MSERLRGGQGLKRTVGLGHQKGCAPGRAAAAGRWAYCRAAATALEKPARKRPAGSCGWVVNRTK